MQEALPEEPQLEAQPEPQPEQALHCKIHDEFECCRFLFYIICAMICPIVAFGIVYFTNASYAVTSLTVTVFGLCSVCLILSSGNAITSAYRI